MSLGAQNSTPKSGRWQTFLYLIDNSISHPLPALTITVCLTLAIMFGVQRSLDQTIEETIAEAAEVRAKSRARFFAENLPDIENLLYEGIANDRQEELIQFAIGADDVFRFTLFDTEGHLVYVSDLARYRKERGPNVSETAYEIFESGMNQVFVRDGRTETNRPDTYAQAFVPVISKEGETIGVVELYTDETAHKAKLWSKFRPIVVFLPILCAFVYIIPALGFLIKAYQSKRREAEVMHLSRFDALTGLLNRNTITAEYHAFFEDRRNSQKSIGVLFIDIDNFKEINDQNGHEFGDEFLRHVARNLQKVFRNGHLVGRMGGDEFLVIMRDVTKPAFAQAAQKVLKAINTPFQYKGRTIIGSISVGTHLGIGLDTPEEIIHFADLALYHAKASGRNRVIEYFDELEEAQSRRRWVESRIQNALDNDSFAVAYQPIVNGLDERIVGFEALLRLHPEGEEPISPAEFIPIAEESGVINQIGLMVLKKAVKQAKTWPDHIFISVNLSPLQFEDGNIVSAIDDLLTECTFPASRLELEITESVLLVDEVHVIQQLAGLRALGVSIAMDDFGTGYSSLGHLWRYHFDKLKIDRSFLSNHRGNLEKQSDILETIVTLGRKMNMKVTAEGVEEREQADMLKLMDCDLFQGYFFGRPMSGDDTIELLYDEQIERLEGAELDEDDDEVLSIAAAF